MQRARYHSGDLRCFALLFAFCCGTLLAQSPLQRAVELTRAGRYAEARKIIEGVGEPSDPAQKIAFHRLRAAIASGLNEPQAAMTEMEAALALAPNDSNLLLATAAAEMLNGSFQSALVHVQATNSSPARERLIGQIEQHLCDHAVELIKHAQFEPAIAELKEARAAVPKSAMLLVLLGIANYGYGFSDDAILALNDAIDADPRSHSGEPVLAKIVLQSSAAPSDRTSRQLCAWNDIVCAAVDLRRARASGNTALFAKATDVLERAPRSDAVRSCELARAYEWQNRLNDARRELENCVHLDGNPQNHYRLGILYQRLGESALAAQEMARRAELLKTMSEETALASAALSASQITKQY